MVQRSGFYVDNNSIIQRIVYIEWDLGFDAYAKQRYIERIKNAFGDDKGILLDVTSASNEFAGKMLSPIFVKMKNEGVSVEDYLHKLQLRVPNLFEISGATDYVYLSNLSKFNKETIQKYHCFSDVFHNPAKQYGNTQACSLAVYKLLCAQDKEALLENAEEFLNWYQSIDFRREEI